MPTRREAIQALISAPILGASWVIPALALSPPKNVTEIAPKILDERPPIIGVPGTTYFHINIQPHICQVWTGHVFLDGKDIHINCFEVDLEGQWVGMYVWRLLTGDTIPMHDGSGYVTMSMKAEIETQWVRGLVEVK